MQIKITFLLIVCCLLLNACVGKKILEPDELKTSHSVLVLPYKASSIEVKDAAVQASADAVRPLAGPLVAGSVAAIVRANSADERTKISEKLEEQSGELDLGMVAAEVCLDVLLNDTKASKSISKSSIGNLQNAPSRNPSSHRKQKKFSESKDNDSYNRISFVFGGNSTFLEYKKKNGNIDSDWILEIFVTDSSFTNTHISVGLGMKLNNSKTNEIIAEALTIEGYNINEFKKGYCFDDFIIKYRDAIRKSCALEFRVMGL